MSGSKTTTNNTEKVTLPAWMSQGGEQNFANAQQFAAANPITPYTGPLAAGGNANQTLASTIAGQTGVGAGDLAASREMNTAATANGAPQVQAGQFNPAAVQQYMNPYTSTVTNSTLDSMRRSNAIDQAGLADQVQQARAFGGARGTLAATELYRGQNRNMMDFVNRSNEAGYNNAQGQFNADANRALSADATNAASKNSLYDRLISAAAQRSNIGAQAQEFTSNDIANLLRTGATQQNTEQGQIEAAYADKQLNDNAAMQRYQQLASLLGMTPTDKTATTKGTTTQNGGLLNSLLAAGQIGASIFGASDRRLKSKITPLGVTTADGLDMYAWRYIGSGELSVGVMADDVARLRPDALGPVIDGFATVDYGRLAA
jgi:hypothetical protein